MRKHNTYVSLRQSSEWGMRALQGTFTRLKSRLPSNKRKRYLLLSVIVLLHNSCLTLFDFVSLLMPAFGLRATRSLPDRVPTVFSLEVELD